MGQYFKAYSPSRKSIAEMDYLNYGNLVKNVHKGTPEEINEVFDDIELKMNAGFGEYVLVGDYGTLVYRSGDEQNPSYIIIDDNKGLTDIVWG